MANINDLHRLNKNECAFIAVEAISRWNASNILFKKGEEYQIEVRASQNEESKQETKKNWNDGPNITVDGNGWKIDGSKQDLGKCLDSSGKQAEEPQEITSGFSFFIKMLRGLRRSPDCAWFYLVGVIQNMTLASSAQQEVPLGNQGVIKVLIDGEFGCYANDLSFKYGNNSGALQLKITRVQ